MAQTAKSDYETCSIKSPNKYVGGADGVFTLICNSRFSNGTVLEDYWTECEVDVIADPQLEDGNYYHQVRLRERDLGTSLVNYTKEGLDCLFKIIS